MVCRNLFAACLLWSVVLPVEAQQDGSKPVKFAIRGKITVIGLGQGKILLTSPSGPSCTLVLTPQTATRLVGMADPDILVPGVCVRFIGTMDKRTGRLQEKVTALTVFTPGETPDRTLGMTPPDPRTPAPGTIPPHEQMGGPVQIPGAGKAAPPVAPGPGGGLPGANPPAAGKAKKPLAEKIEVHGRILSNRAGKMVVDVSTQHSRRKLLAELAPDAKVAVDLNDCSHAKPGDAIEAIGNQMGPGMSTVEALEIRIDMAAPLVGTRRGRHPPVAKRPPEKPGEETAKLPTETAPPGAAAGQPDKAQQLVQFLQLPPAELVGKQGMKVGSKDGTTLEFTPCRPEATKDIVEKFGQPDRIAIPHLFTDGPDGQKTKVAWQLWFYGNVMFFVDETGAARYYSLVPKPAKPPEKKAEKKE